MTMSSVAVDMFQVMPPLSAEEYAELKADIQARGVMVPIEYDEDGAVLDVSGFNQDRTKLLTLKPGSTKGYWQVSWYDFAEQCEFVAGKEVATSRLHLYIPLHQFSLSPVKRLPKTSIDNHCVYFIGAESTNLIKIGTTNGNAEYRLNQIKTMSPVPLRVIGSIPGDREVEKELHKRFARYRHHGEWFVLEGELQEYVFETFLGANQ